MREPVPRSVHDFDELPATTTVWRAVSRLLGWLVAIALVCLGLAYFKPQMARQAALEAELRGLREALRAEEEKHEALRAQLDWIKNDPAYLEVQARDRLDMAREGETVVRFGEAPR